MERETSHLLPAEVLLRHIPAITRLEPASRCEVSPGKVASQPVGPGGSEALIRRLPVCSGCRQTGHGQKRLVFEESSQPALGVRSITFVATLQVKPHFLCRTERVAFGQVYLGDIEKCMRYIGRSKAQLTRRLGRFCKRAGYDAPSQNTPQHIVGPAVGVVDFDRAPRRL